MKKIVPLICVMLTFAVSACVQLSSADMVQDECRQDAAVCGSYSPHTLIIFFDAQTGSLPLTTAVGAYGAEILYEYRMLSGMAIKIPQGKTLEDAEAYFSKIRGVTAVNRDRIMSLH